MPLIKIKIVFLGVLIPAVVVLLASFPVCAEDLAILWDISKSVPEGLYRDDVRNAVRDVVSGRGVSSSWQQTRPEPLETSVDQVLSGKRPMAGNKDRILIVHFGSLDRASKIQNLPFSAWEFNVQQRSDLGAQLLAKFPTRSTDQWTNKNLAEAAAARYFYDRKSSMWFLLMISDFNEDNRETLKPIERQFVDEYEAQLFAFATPPVVLRWKDDPRIIMKLKRVVARGGGKNSDLTNITKTDESRPQKLLELVSPANGAKIPSDRKLAFFWRWLGESPPNGYHVVVTHAEGPGGTVFSKSSPVSSVTSDKMLPPGRYRWQVFALLTDGSASSQPLSFSVEGGAGAGWIVGTLLLAAVAGGLLYANMRRRKKEG
jgi:hypothetical protein